MDEKPDISKMPELPPGYKWGAVSLYPRDLFLYSPHREASVIAYWEFATNCVVSQKHNPETVLKDCTLEEGAAYIAQLCWMGEL